MNSKNNLGIIVLLFASVLFLGCGDEQDDSLNVSTTTATGPAVVTKCLPNSTASNGTLDATTRCTPSQPLLKGNGRGGGNISKQGDDDTGALP